MRVDAVTVQAPGGAIVSRFQVVNRVAAAVGLPAFVAEPTLIGWLPIGGVNSAPGSDAPLNVAVR